MGNIAQNLINATLTPANVTSMTGHVTSIENLLPNGGNFALTEEELSHMLGMDVDNRVQAEKVSEQMTIRPNMLPAIFVLANLNNDRTLFTQMETLIAMLQGLIDKMTFLQRAAADDANTFSLAAYNYIKAGAAMGIADCITAYDILKERFEGQGGGAPTVGV